MSEEIKRKISYDGRGALPGVGIISFVRDTWFDADENPHTHYNIEVQEKQYFDAMDAYQIEEVFRRRND